MDVTYSVIIPTYNEAANIQKTTQHIRKLVPDTQVIVVDGGSNDATVALARSENAEVVLSRAGRGVQCNAGARHATGEILLFLHADTFLPANAFELLTKFFSDGKTQIGTFRLSFDEQRPLLRFYCSFTRFDSIFTRFGDQCIVVRKSFFDQIHGFPDWALFEDVELLRTARRYTSIVSFPAEVITSARRFVKMGIIHTQLVNGVLLLLYFLGVSPSKLARLYAIPLKQNVKNVKTYP